MAEPTSMQSGNQQAASTMEANLGVGAAAMALNQGLNLLPDSIKNNIPLLNQLSKSFDVVGKTALSFAGVSDNLQKNIGNLTSVFSTNFPDALAKLADQLKDQIKKYQELDKSIAQLGRENSKAFIESMRQQSFDSAKLGISLENLIEYNKELLKNYNGATLVVQRQTDEFNKNQKQITELMGFNHKFGVTAQQTTDVLKLFNNTMGGGSQAAQKFSDNLLIFAEKTGQSATKVFTDFNSSVDRFSTLTADRAVASFQKIQMFASRTGESVSGVMTAIGKFDDIEQGFQTGGQLNRVLSFMGGSFDTFKAVQATDEERAQMLLTAISGVSEKYSTLQNEQSKRLMAKQIAESAGLDVKTVVGLLTKSTNLSEDIAEISKKPIVSEEFTEQGRKNAAMRLTTSEEMKKIQDGMTELNPLVVRLSNVMDENSKAFTNLGVSFFKDFDSKYGKLILSGTPADFMKAGGDLAANVKDLPSKFKNKFDEIMADYRKNTKPTSDAIVSGNTTTMGKIHETLKNGINTKVEIVGKIEGPDGKPANVKLKHDPAKKSAVHNAQRNPATQ